MAKFEFDAKDFQRRLEQLKPLDVQDMMMKALKAGGKILKEKAVANLRQYTKGGADKTSKRWKKPMVKGIRQINDDNITNVIISILSDPRVLWWNEGTQERYKDMDKRTGYRGKIPNTNFFSKSIAETEDEMIRKIEQVLIKEIEKATE